MIFCPERKGEKKQTDTIKLWGFGEFCALGVLRIFLRHDFRKKRKGLPLPLVFKTFTQTPQRWCAKQLLYGDPPIAKHDNGCMYVLYIQVQVCNIHTDIHIGEIWKMYVICAMIYVKGTYLVFCSLIRRYGLFYFYLYNEIGDFPPPERHLTCFTNKPAA